jgi:MFS family permease
MKKRPMDEDKDFDRYGWVVLAVLILVRISHQMSQQQLGYIFGFKGEGDKAGDPFYEITAAFPDLFANYGLLSGPAFSTSYCIAGLFGGALVDRFNRKTLLGLVSIIWSLSSVVSGSTNSFLVLCLMRFVCGMCVSITDPA